MVFFVLLAFVLVCFAGYVSPLFPYRFFSDSGHGALEARPLQSQVKDQERKQKPPMAERIQRELSSKAELEVVGNCAAWLKF